MQGWKTIVFAVATALLGLLQSAGITDVVAQHPGAITTAVGVAIAALRFVTTTTIFTAK